MNFSEITTEELIGKGVVGLPDTPGLSTQDMQRKFDELVLDVMVPKFNALIKELATLKNVESVTDNVEDTSTSLPTGKAVANYVTELGGGDMMRNIYDVDKNGVVDDSEKLGGQLPSYYAKKQDLDELNSKLDSKQNDIGFKRIATTYTGSDVDVKLTDGIFLFIGFQGGSLAMSMLSLVSVTSHEESSYISDIVTAKVYNPTLSINSSTKILTITPNVAGFAYTIIRII